MSEYAEPWANHRPAAPEGYTELHAIFDSMGRFVAHADTPGPLPAMTEHSWEDYKAQVARIQSRIIACVNACVGIDTERLSMVEPGRLATLFEENWP